MNENFDRAPGAGRTRSVAAESGDEDARISLLNQREPLRQPRTSPPFAENNTGTAAVLPGGGRELTDRSQAAAFRSDSSKTSPVQRVDGGDESGFVWIQSRSISGLTPPL